MKMRGIKNKLGIFTRVPMTKDLIVGEFFYFLLVEIIIILVSWSFNKAAMWSWILGFFEGFLLSVFLLLHMAYALEDSVVMFEEEAEKHTKKTYAFRMVVLIAGFLLIVFLKLGNIGAALLGLMSLKVAAYLQPITHKFIQKNI